MLSGALPRGQRGDDRPDPVRACRRPVHQRVQPAGFPALPGPDLLPYRRDIAARPAVVATAAVVVVVVAAADDDDVRRLIAEPGPSVRGLCSASRQGLDRRRLSPVFRGGDYGWARHPKSHATTSEPPEPSAVVPERGATAHAQSPWNGLEWVKARDSGLTKGIRNWENESGYICENTRVWQR